MPPFDYSTKMLLTDDKMEEQWVIAIRKLKKGTKRENPKWVTSTRPEDVYYVDEEVSAIKGIGTKKLHN